MILLTGTCMFNGGQNACPICSNCNVRHHSSVDFIEYHSEAIRHCSVKPSTSQIKYFRCEDEVHSPACIGRYHFLENIEEFPRSVYFKLKKEFAKKSHY